MIKTKDKVIFKPGDLVTYHYNPNKVKRRIYIFIEYKREFNFQNYEVDRSALLYDIYEKRIFRDNFPDCYDLLYREG